MSKLFFCLFLLCSVFTSYAQRKTGGPQKMDPAQIPAAVKTAQESSFPGIAVTQWEVRSKTGPGQFVSKYTAVFSVDSKMIHARYKGDGTLVSSLKFFEGEEAPSVVKSLGSKYNEYALRTTVEIKTYAKGKVFYRAYFYKGKKKTVVYVDDNGKELVIEKVPAEVKEGEEFDN
jgi:hypothetical protein